MQAAIAMAPIAIAAAPTLATTMPAICGELNCVSVATEAESWAEAGAVAVAEVLAEEDAGSLAVGRGVLEANVLEIVITLGVLDVTNGLLVGVDVACTVLGLAVSIMRVAVSVSCVFGNALGLPTHILYAFSETRELPLSSSQNPTLFSAIIHCSAPSPAVKPDVLLCVHKQSKVGDVEHADWGKFASRKEIKHDCAHGGINFVISFSKKYVVEEEDWAIACFVVKRVYIRARKLAGKTPISGIL